MSFLIIAFGFLLALRGMRPASLQKPFEGLVCLWREAADLFLTVLLILAMEAFALAAGGSWGLVQDYAVLVSGLVAWLLSRYQKKTDVFFLAVVGILFMIRMKNADLFLGFSLAWALVMGIALFQTFFLGLRHRLLFARLPGSMKGWPLLCLLAASLSMLLGGVVSVVF